jgi:hypothetical protein
LTLNTSPYLVQERRKNSNNKRKWIKVFPTSTTTLTPITAIPLN